MKNYIWTIFYKRIGVTGHFFRTHGRVHVYELKTKKEVMNYIKKTYPNIEILDIKIWTNECN